MNLDMAYVMPVFYVFGIIASYIFYRNFKKLGEKNPEYKNTKYLAVVIAIVQVICLIYVIYETINFN